MDIRLSKGNKELKNKITIITLLTNNSIKHNILLHNVHYDLTSNKINCLNSCLQIFLKRGVNQK